MSTESINNTEYINYLKRESTERLIETIFNYIDLLDGFSLSLDPFVYSELEERLYSDKINRELDNSWELLQTIKNKTNQFDIIYSNLKNIKIADIMFDKLYISDYESRNSIILNKSFNLIKLQKDYKETNKISLKNQIKKSENEIISDLSIFLEDILFSLD